MMLATLSANANFSNFPVVMVYFILAAIFMWLLSGVLIYRVASKVLRYPSRCSALIGTNPIKPEWAPFVRTYDERFKKRSKFLAFVTSLSVAPARILISVSLIVINGVAALTLSSSAVAAVARWVSRSILRVMGIRVTRIGTRLSVREAPCVVANHISAMDILALLSLGCCFVANNKVLDLPGIGRVAKAIGCIFVARDSQESRASAKEAITQRLLDSSPEVDTPDAQLVIFPEGTTTNGRGLLQFRRGAFESGVTIQPVRIDYSDLQCSMSILSIWNHVCLLSVLSCDKEISVQFLDPVHNSGPDETASIVRSKIANAKSPYSSEPLTLFESGSHRDEAELTRVVSRMTN